MKLLPALVMIAGLLGGCGAPTTSANAPRSAGARPAPNTYSHGAPHSAQPRANGDGGSGGSGVIGRDAAALARMFGTPRLDRHDGAAHVLQYTNDRCVLDAYLYAPRGGAQAVVTHVDTRGLDGSAVDSDACIAALQRR